MATNVVHTLKASGGDYSSLISWESGTQRDLVALDETETLECYKDGWPTGLSQGANELAITGWTTGVNNFITIKAAPGSEAKFPIADCFFVYGAPPTNGLIGCNQSYTKFIGLAAISSTAQACWLTLTSAQPGYEHINCVYENTLATASQSRALRFAHTSSLCTIRNTIAVSRSTGGLSTRYAFFVLSGTSTNIENCTFISYGSGYAVEAGTGSGSGINFVNTVAINLTGAAGWEPAMSWTGNNNASNDTSAPGTEAQHNVSTVDGVDITSYSAGNFVPVGGGKLDGTGADLSSSFSTDITGAARTVPWDIGAYVSAGAGPPTYAGSGTAALAAALAAVGLGTYVAPSAPTYVGSGSAALAAALAAVGAATYSAPSAPVYIGSGTGSLTANLAAVGAGTYTIPVAPSYTGGGTAIQNAILGASGAGTFVSSAQVVFSPVPTPINWYVGQTVNTSLAPFVTGGTGTYVYSVESGTLPAGLALNSSTGVITGTPTVNSNGNISFRAAENGNPSNFAISNVVNLIVSTPSLLGGIFVGGVEVLTDKLWKGNQKVQAVYKGAVKVWENLVPGQQNFTTAGTFQWTCPAGVSSVCVVAIGGGRTRNGVSGGGGGGLGWKNNIPVVPGVNYTVVVGAVGGASYFIDTATVAGLSGAAGTAGGSRVGDGGGNGGNGGNGYLNGSFFAGGGGGGAGGYISNGGNGAAYSNNGLSGTVGSPGGGGGGLQSISSTSPGGRGGGVGIRSDGATNTGAGGAVGLSFTTAAFPGGNGSGSVPYGAGAGGGSYGALQDAVSGAVRIIWGPGRSYPDNAADV
jgi:Putative Ig domain